MKITLKAITALSLLIAGVSLVGTSADAGPAGHHTAGTPPTTMPTLPTTMPTTGTGTAAAAAVQ